MSRIGAIGPSTKRIYTRVIYGCANNLRTSGIRCAAIRIGAMPRSRGGGYGGYRNGSAVGGAVITSRVASFPHLGDAGMGINRRLPHLGNAGKGINRQHTDTLLGYLTTLSSRMSRVRVCCGDWTRILGPSPTTKNGLTGVFLDPPYNKSLRDGVYNEDSDISDDVQRWAIEHGADKLMRIALCGYEGEHAMPSNWECVAWKANGGYGAQSHKLKLRGRSNADLERIWFSPHCLKPEFTE